jgi:allophanate hydrolase subunit 2
LRAGDRLPLGAASLDGPDQRLDVSLACPTVIRVVLGPQDDYFSPGSLAAFLSTSFTITTASDRMGHRLTGARLTGSKGFNITSDSIPPGAIQVPGDGHPILLLADRQTTGGYPKIATVISADIPALGRIGPGAVVRFASISIKAAEAAARVAAEAQASWRLVPIGGNSFDPARLYDANLVSGVVSAAEER